MTVTELRKALENMPNECEVWIPDDMAIGGWSIAGECRLSYRSDFMFGGPDYPCIVIGHLNQS
jgi:hypothetical protein